MAKLTARIPFGCESKDPFRFRVGSVGDEKKKKRVLLENPIGIHRRSNRGIRFSGFSRVCANGKRSGGFKAEEKLRSGGGDEEDEDEEYDDEFERDELSCFRGLVLDISYRPINVVCWKRAICLEFTEKADVLEYYDQTVSSAQGSFYIPAVLRVPHLLQVVKRRRIKQSLSRKNIFYRDSYSCQYCSTKENLTIDHVLPISRGGEWTWENLVLICSFNFLGFQIKCIIRNYILLVSYAYFLVTACSRCNSRKGQKTIEEANMKLIKTPKAPRDFDILAIPLTTAAVKMLKTRKGVPEEWMQYLGKAAP